jgi:hypothetical protein
MPTAGRVAVAVNSSVESPTNGTDFFAGGGGIRGATTIDAQYPANGAGRTAFNQSITRQLGLVGTDLSALVRDFERQDAANIGAEASRRQHMPGTDFNVASDSSPDAPSGVGDNYDNNMDAGYTDAGEAPMSASSRSDEDSARGAGGAAFSLGATLRPGSLGGAAFARGVDSGESNSPLAENRFPPPRKAPISAVASRLASIKGVLSKASVRETGGAAMGDLAAELDDGVGASASSSAPPLGGPSLAAFSPGGPGSSVLSPEEAEYSFEFDGGSPGVGAANLEEMRPEHTAFDIVEEQDIIEDLEASSQSGDRSGDFF